MQTVGVVSPGAMGSALAAALARGGARVVATLAGRSERTAGLAGAAPIEALPDLGAVVREADVVLSVVPPEAAPGVAADIARAATELRGSEPHGRLPLLADLNAIAPATVRGFGDLGLELVDGSISGPPPRAGRRPTRLYLSGTRAEEVAALPFESVDVTVVGPDVGSASAVKMSTASVYKGTTALLAQALLAAQENGVLEHVVADLRAAAPELLADLERRLTLATTKARRYVGEMREIADTQAAADLTPALFEGIAEVYERLAQTPLSGSSLEEVNAEARLADVLGRMRRG